MKTMNMPGFTAEGSLYKTRKHYQLKGNAMNNFSEGNSLVYQLSSECGDCSCSRKQCCNLDENGACFCAKCGGGPIVIRA
jgi:hypothetical protein